MKKKHTELQKGDRVRCKNGYDFHLVRGHEYVVTRVVGDDNVELEGVSMPWHMLRFELIGRSVSIPGIGKVTLTPRRTSEKTQRY